MTQWEDLEEYIIDNDLDGSDFSSGEYADDVGIDPAEASAHIQGYQSAQRAERSNTLFVLHRVPGTRTRNARWLVSIKSKDVDLMGRSFFDDTSNRFHQAVKADLQRLAAINPRQARKVTSRVNAIVNGALVMLAAAVEGDTDDGEPG